MKQPFLPGVPAVPRGVNFLQCVGKKIQSVCRSRSGSKYLVGFDDGTIAVLCSISAEDAGELNCLLWSMESLKQFSQTAIAEFSANQLFKVFPAELVKSWIRENARQQSEQLEVEFDRDVKEFKRLQAKLAAAGRLPSATGEL